MVDIFVRHVVLNVVDVLFMMIVIVKIKKRGINPLFYYVLLVLLLSGVVGSVGVDGGITGEDSLSFCCCALSHSLRYVP